MFIPSQHALYFMTTNSREQFKKLSSHPLIILIVGASVSSLIFPYFTGQWQDHQKELELKTTLSDEINNAVSDLVTSARLVGNPFYSNVTNYGETYKDWQTSKGIISSKIQAYFSDDRITSGWKNLSAAVTEFQGIGAGLPKSPYYTYDYLLCFRLSHILKMYEIYPQNNPFNVDRTVLERYNCNNYYMPVLEDGHFQKYQKYFPIGDDSIPLRKDGINWNALLYRNSTNIVDRMEYDKSFSTIEKYIENDKSNLLSTIFNSPIAVFK
jgi:hypothetical protein